MSNFESLPYVEAELNYLGPMTERPRYYAYETDAGERRSNMAYDPHTMRIHDLRPIYPIWTSTRRVSRCSSRGARCRISGTMTRSGACTTPKRSAS